MSRLRVERLSRPGVEAGGLEVEGGHCTTLYGPSGSGKTLLLRAIADLDEAQGEVWLDGRARSAMSGPQWRRLVTYVAAESAWWGDHVRDHADVWRVADLAAVGFAPDVLDWDVQRLSSGERQRLAVVRALAHDPAALLLDEPTANLDQANTELVERLIADWNRRTKAAVVWVSHDPAQRRRVGSAHYAIANGVPVPGDGA